MKRNKNIEYDSAVNYDALEQHEYADADGYTFYTCPTCGGEYLATFMVDDGGQTMCSDCWDKRH